jgi:hypothetical protein
MIRSIEGQCSRFVAYQNMSQIEFIDDSTTG